MKHLLLSTCLLGGLAAALYAVPAAQAQNAKPGQRLIYDDRLPEEAPQLGKPIFNREIKTPEPQKTPQDAKQTSNDKAAAGKDAQGEATPEAGAEEKAADTGDAADAAAAQDGEEKGGDASLFIKDGKEEPGKDGRARGREDAGKGKAGEGDDSEASDTYNGGDASRDPDRFERDLDMNQSSKTERKLEKLDKELPYGNMSDDEFAKLSAQDQKKVIEAQKAYVEKYKKDIVEDSRKD